MDECCVSLTPGSQRSLRAGQKETSVKGRHVEHMGPPKVPANPNTGNEQDGGWSGSDRFPVVRRTEEVVLLTELRHFYVTMRRPELTETTGLYRNGALCLVTIVTKKSMFSSTDRLVCRPLNPVFLFLLLKDDTDCCPLLVCGGNSSLGFVFTCRFLALTAAAFNPNRNT